MCKMNDVKLALIICTYNRRDYVIKNLKLLKSSHFFDSEAVDYYRRLEIFVIDNASELNLEHTDLCHYYSNRNTGGAGGFQRGIEEVRRQNAYSHFTHVIFMDDDVEFDIESFYLLFDFLKNANEKDIDRPVVGRMLDKDHPSIQWTAAEKWNGGNIIHTEFLRDVSEQPFVPGKVNYDADAEYGGFWFACYPYSFVKDNDILPFFIHCDDVEYGLRCGKKPILIEGVHVWHETFEKRVSPWIRYYDTRNPLIVNEIYGFLPPKQKLFDDWKDSITEYHNKEDYLSEYMLIIAMRDFLRGMRWLKRVDSEKYNRKLRNMTSNRWKNAIAWRWVSLLIKMKRF